jgi:hypothetical protein
VAAAIVADTAVETVPASTNTATSAGAIGAQSKPRAQTNPPHSGTQDALDPADASEASDAAPVKAQDTVTTRAALTDPAAGSASGTKAQQARAGTDNTTSPTQPNGSTQTDEHPNPPSAADLAAARADATAALTPADSANGAKAPSATGAAKSATADPSTLGLAPGNVATTQAATTEATTATSGSALAAAVPIAGLPVTIAAHAQGGLSQFDIRLDPPDLGRIDVRLGFDSNGQVTSHVTVDRPETLTLLQSQQPQLEQALQQAGLKTADNGLQFSLRDQSFTGQNNNGSGTQQNAPQVVIPDPDLASVETRQIYSRAALGGGVDIRV